MDTKRVLITLSVCSIALAGFSQEPTSYALLTLADPFPTDNVVSRTLQLLLYHLCYKNANQENSARLKMITKPALLFLLLNTTLDLDALPIPNVYQENVQMLESAKEKDKEKYAKHPRIATWD